MKASFKPRARLLQLLGEQLIGTPQLAIFELVKNGYDADADSVEVVITSPEDVENSAIVVTDINGIGMDEDIILNIWLEPGADHKKLEKESGIKTSKHGRLPLGEKGVGRFAVHKLGRRIELITRAQGSAELSLEIDWDDLDKCKYIDEMSIEVTSHEEPRYFKGDMTGTRILISKLKTPMTKRSIRDLHRNIESIKSPFQHTKLKLDKKVDTFDVNLSVKGSPDWLEDLPSMLDIVDKALFKFAFFFKAGKWSWYYDFNPNEQLKKEFKVSDNNQNGEEQDFSFSNKSLNNDYKEDKFTDLGEMFGEIYVFDFDSNLRNFYSDSTATKKFLSENSGVRIYRDGMRVYNYGEPHDDWLQMDSRRVNRLSSGLNRSITVGGISLSLADTPKLKEKTNREGFIENETYQKLFDVVSSSLSKFESLRDLDKKRLRILMKEDTKTSITGIENPIEELKAISVQKNLEEALQPTIQKIEKSYNEMRDIMLTAGMAGLNMSIAFHEIHRGIKDTKRAIENNTDTKLILLQFERFELLLDAYGDMLKKEKIREYGFSDLLKGVKDITSPRFTMHDIITSCPVLVGDEEDYKVKMPVHLLTSAVNNLIDNAVYWLDQRWGKDDTKNKYIYIGTSDEFEKGPAIIIADSGPGLRGISPEEVVKPFHTTKPGGMGIGLYYTKTVMDMIGGELVILESNDLQVPVPAHADGLVIALVFKEEKQRE
jgi:signal transduction histidine kinase